MKYLNEIPIVFSCAGESLIGIIHPTSIDIKIGLLIVVGGPQYRVGSHRQFVLLARYLAKKGIPVMRFDYRGMGDSSGRLQSFEDINQDISAAIDNFMEKVPSLEKVVIWGLCDAASAGLLYAYHDKRVTGLVLVNPWVRTELGEAKTYLKYYYVHRIFQKSFWTKVISGRFNPFQALNSLFGLVKVTINNNKIKVVDAPCLAGTLPDKMLYGLKNFCGSILVIISGRDLTAKEFCDLIRSTKNWHHVLENKNVEFKELPEADHTFSSSEWRHQVEKWTEEWLIKKMV